MVPTSLPEPPKPSRTLEISQKYIYIRTSKFILLQRCCLELGLLYFGGRRDGRLGSWLAGFPELYLVMVMVVMVKPSQPARIQAAAPPRALFSCNSVVYSLGCFI